MRIFGILLIVFLIGTIWIRSSQKIKDPAPSPPAFAKLPLRLTVSQRSTTILSGSRDQLALTTGDITRGQVLVSIAHAKNDPLLGPVSMQPGDSQSLRFDAVAYTLRLTELKNALIGEDYASFILAAEDSTAPPTETGEIEQLLAAIAMREDIVFIRNGSQHTAKEAAEHLRSKLRATGNKIQTADEFIELLASHSSFSGKPYEIRLPDGQTVLAKDYLHKILSELKSANSP